MFHLDNQSGVPEMPEVKPLQSNTPRWFGESDEQGGISWPGADWFNVVQAELLNVLSAADISPKKDNFAQLIAAITVLNDRLVALKQGGRVQDGLSFFTPKMFGAIADGVTDDSAAFSAAIAAMPSGAVLDLQGLTYLAEVAVNKNNVTIQNGNVVAPYSATKAAVFVNGVNDVSIVNVNATVDNDNRASYVSDNVSGIHFENANNCRAISCRATGSKCDNYGLDTSWGCPIHAYKCTNVSFENCVGVNSHKEGIMARMCDEVFISNCRGYNSGYSDIGTSGGNKAVVTGCYSYNAGASGVSVNSKKSVVSACVVDSNRSYNGIVVGHNHESAQYSEEVAVTGCVVSDSASNGIAVVAFRTVAVSGNSIKNAGKLSAGNGILLSHASDENDVTVSISGNSINGASAAGIYCAIDKKHSADINIDGNTINNTGVTGVRVENDGVTVVGNNIVSNAVGNGIQVRAATTDNSLRAGLAKIHGNTVRGATLNGIDTGGQKSVVVTDNDIELYNSSQNANCCGVTHHTTLVSADGKIELPDFTDVSGNRFSGNNGNTANATVYFVTDDLSTDGKVLKLSRNHFSDATKQPVNYPASRQRLTYQSNTRGVDATLVTESIPANTGKTISNSNQTANNIPNVALRTAGAYRVSSIVLGSITIANDSASEISVSVQY